MCPRTQSWQGAEPRYKMWAIWIWAWFPFKGSQSSRRPQLLKKEHRISVKHYLLLIPDWSAYCPSSMALPHCLFSPNFLAFLSVLLFCCPPFWSNWRAQDLNIPCLDWCKNLSVLGLSIFFPLQNYPAYCYRSKLSIKQMESLHIPTWES